MTDRQKRLCRDMVKYSIYLARLMENEFGCTFITLEDLEVLLTNKEKQVTHKRATENLFINAEKYCKGSDLFDKIKDLNEEMEENILSQAMLLTGKMEFIDCTQMEQEAYIEELRERSNVLAGYISIAQASILSGVNHAAIKQACTRGKLLSGRKVGKSWEINYQEVKEYWKK